RGARAVPRQTACPPDCRAEREIPGARRPGLYARQWPNRLRRHGRGDAGKRCTAPRLFRFEIIRATRMKTIARFRTGVCDLILVLKQPRNVSLWPFATFGCNAMTYRFRGESRLSSLVC